MILGYVIQGDASLAPNYISRLRREEPAAGADWR
jgi:hypothetical protein